MDGASTRLESSNDQNGFYDANNPDLPREISITLKRPKNKRSDLSVDEFYEELMDRVRAKEIAYKAKRRDEGRRCMGERKIAKQHWNHAPRSYEVRFIATQRVRNRDSKKRIATLQLFSIWRTRYAEARRKLRAGHENVKFPYGTYWMRRFAGVNTANAPP